MTRGFGRCGIEVFNCFVIRGEVELSPAKMPGWLVSREKDGSIGGLHIYQALDSGDRKVMVSFYL